MATRTATNRVSTVKRCCMHSGWGFSFYSGSNQRTVGRVLHERRAATSSFGKAQYPSRDFPHSLLVRRSHLRSGSHLPVIPPNQLKKNHQVSRPNKLLGTVSCNESFPRMSEPLEYNHAGCYVASEGITTGMSGARV